MKRLLALHHAVGHVGVFLSVLGVESRDLPVISTGSSVYCLQKVLGLEPCNKNKRSFNKGYVGVSSRQQPAAPQKKSEHESERNCFFVVFLPGFYPHAGCIRRSLVCNILLVTPWLESPRYLRASIGLASLPPLSRHHTVHGSPISHSASRPPNRAGETNTLTARCRTPSFWQSSPPSGGYRARCCGSATRSRRSRRGSAMHGTVLSGKTA